MNMEGLWKADAMQTACSVGLTSIVESITIPWPRELSMEVP